MHLWRGEGVLEISAEEYDRFRELVYMNLGLLLPLLYQKSDPELPNGSYQWQINDCRMPAVRPGGAPILESLASQLAYQPGDLLSCGLVTTQLAALRRGEAGLVNTFILQFSPANLALILRSLLDEGLPIYNLAFILEGLLASNQAAAQDTLGKYVFYPQTGILCLNSAPQAPEDFGLADYLACLRLHLRDLYLGRVAPGNQINALMLIDQNVLADLNSLDTDLNPAGQAERIRLAIWEAKMAWQNTQGLALVAFTSEHRQRLREIIWQEISDLPVISLQEVPLRAKFQVLDYITYPAG